MSWNYRIIRYYHSKSREYTFEIHEVYYKKDGEIDLWTENTIAPFGTSLEELVSSHAMMKSAFRKPILKEVGRFKIVNGVRTKVTKLVPVK
jgi:hypothetical protein